MRVTIKTKRQTTSQYVAFRESQQWGGWGGEKEGENFGDEKMKEPQGQGKRWTA